MAKIKYEKPLSADDGVVSAVLEDGTRVPQYRIISAKQCMSESIGHKCQGCLGHDGDHWAYSESGWLELWPNTKRRLSPWESAHSSTPPGHESYIHPAVMIKRSAASNCRYEDLSKKPAAPARMKRSAGPRRNKKAKKHGKAAE